MVEEHANRMNKNTVVRMARDINNQMTMTGALKKLPSLYQRRKTFLYKQKN